MKFGCFAVVLALALSPQLSYAGAGGFVVFDCTADELCNPTNWSANGSAVEEPCYEGYSATFQYDTQRQVIYADNDKYWLNEYYEVYESAGGLIQAQSQVHFGHPNMVLESMRTGSVSFERSTDSSGNQVASFSGTYEIESLSTAPGVGFHKTYEFHGTCSVS